MRVLEWVVERVHGRATRVVESPIGWMPGYEDIDWRGLEDLTPARFSSLMTVDRERWRRELETQREFFATFGSRLPQKFHEIQAAVAKRFGISDLTSGSASGGPAPYIAMAASGPSQK